MGRPRDSGIELTSRALRKKKRRVPDRVRAVDAKQERRHETRMKLSRVPEEAEDEDQHEQDQEEGGDHEKRVRWLIRVRRGKLVTPVAHYLKRFRQSCTSLATTIAAPFRCHKLGILLAKLHLSRRRNSARIHSLRTTVSPSDECAPLLPRLDF